MFRIKYLWTVAPGDEDKFVRDWQDGTRRIQANCAGAFGSFLIRDQNQSTHFYGIARWESNEAYFAALSVMRTLNLPRMPESYEFFNELCDIPPKK